MSRTLRTTQRDDSNTVLLICDDEDTVPRARVAFESAETDTALQLARSPEEALARLRGCGQYEGAALPDLVLLDLDMAGESAYETLDAIRDDPGLKRLPVIALTTSPDREEVVRSYEAKANACMRKPTDEESFAEVVAVVDRFWLQRVRLPPLSR
ncbi:response regulator [Haloparvum sp. PAK95]|uniref:response regulator n=1 Tax=Haloparvum sp. PAK95 TaxID=3418962 RepID=UPI003D2EAE23